MGGSKVTRTARGAVSLAALLLGISACGDDEATSSDAQSVVTTTSSTSTTALPTTTSTAPTTTAALATTAPPATQPKATQPPRTAPPATNPPAPSCHPSYSGCLDPSSPDYDCAGGSGNGPDYTGPVQVYGSDPYDLDRDGDGMGCED